MNSEWLKISVTFSRDGAEADVRLHGDAAKWLMKLTWLLGLNWVNT